MGEQQHESTPGPERRGHRNLIVVSLVLLVAIAVGGFVFVRLTTQRIKSEGSDGLLCAKASSSLQLVAVSDPLHPSVLQLRISHTTAGQVAAEMSKAHADASPWDQEPRDAPVVQCQSGTVKWVVDAHGRAARLPST